MPRSRLKDPDEFRRRVLALKESDGKLRLRYSIKNLNLIIEASGLTPFQFARKVSIPWTSFSLYLIAQDKGGVKPTVRTLMLIRQHTGVIFYMGVKRGKLFPATPAGLRAAIEHRGITQLQAAQDCGFDRYRLAKYLSGKIGRNYDLTTRTWHQIGRGLNCKFYVPASHDGQ